MRQDAIRQDAIRQGAMRQDPVRQDPVRQDAVRQDAVRQDAVRRGAMRRGAVRQGATRRGNAARQGKARDQARRRCQAGIFFLPSSASVSARPRLMKGYSAADRHGRRKMAALIWLNRSLSELSSASRLMQSAPQ